jgi:hypothetical protein
MSNVEFHQQTTKNVSASAKGRSFRKVLGYKVSVSVAALLRAEQLLQDLLLLLTLPHFLELTVKGSSPFDHHLPKEGKMWNFAITELCKN